MLVEVPEAADDLVAAALGQVGLAAWMTLSWLAPVRAGETVLVLGATGSVGSVAVQVAKLLGASRVVAVGRDHKRLEAVASLGADATVALDGDGFQEQLAEAVDGAPPTLVLDLLCGPALEAAAAVAGAGARIAHVGQSAAPTATFVSGHVRGKQLQILGYSNFAVPLDVLAQRLRGRDRPRGRRAAPPRRRGRAARPRRRRLGAAGRGHDVKLVLVP